MKRVLMIVENDFVNDSRIMKEATTLGSNGYEVKILALHNTGLKHEEDFGCYAVERIELKTRNKLSKSNIYSQVIKYLEFQARCISIGSAFQPDIVHCHDLTTLPIGVKLVGKMKGKPKLVYDSHELWREFLGNKTMGRLVLGARNNMEKKGIKKCDGVITVSDSIADYLMKLYGLNEKPCVLRNIPNKKTFETGKDYFREIFGIKKSQKIVLYQGEIKKGRGVENIIDTMEYVDENIVLVLLGNGNYVDTLKEKVNRLKMISRVFFHSAVKSSELLNYTCTADVGIHLIDNSCLNHYYCLPNKLFEYIQAEIPVICSNFPDMKKIIETYQIGTTVKPDEKEEVGLAINSVLMDVEKHAKLKENCKKAKDILNWENEGKELLRLYSTL